MSNEPRVESSRSSSGRLEGVKHRACGTAITTRRVAHTPETYFDFQAQKSTTVERSVLLPWCPHCEIFVKLEDTDSTGAICLSE